MAEVLTARASGAETETLHAIDGAPSAIDLLHQLRGIHSAMVAAVVAGHGLGHVADIVRHATGSAVAIAAPRLGPPVISASEIDDVRAVALEHYVADRVRDRPARVPACVLCEVPIILDRELVGLVALLSPPRRATMPETTEMLHLAAATTLTKLAIEQARHEVEEDLRDTFLTELRSHAAMSAADIRRRALRLGCDVSRGAVALCADVEPNRSGRLMAAIAVEVPAALTQRLDARVYAILPAVACDDPAEATRALADGLVARLQHQARVGISSFYADPGELRNALQEAELMADVLRESGARSARALGTGSYRLLLRLFVSHPEDVRHFYEGTVGPVVRYDAGYSTDLVATLEAYLEHNCNMNATAAAMFAHRHTIAYRLDRIRELSGLDPARVEDRERLGLGLKAYRILAPGAEA
jgi:sugar diacid utilization regulator